MVALDPNGKPVVENGKVLVKYQLEQDYEYWVHEKNVMDIGSGDLKKKSTSDRQGRKKPAKQKKQPVQAPAEGDADLENAVCIYTDGASSGNPGPSGIGVLLRFGDHEKEISEYIGDATNNIAELQAIKTGLLKVKNRKLPVRVFTDSTYAHGVLVLGWKAKKNFDLVSGIRELISTFNDFKIYKVKGHAGHTENERADFLATSAVRKAVK